MQQPPDDGPGIQAPWTAAERFAFRAVFAYFVLFAVASLLDSGRAPRRVLSAIHDPVVGWFGHNILGLRGTPNDPGAVWAIAQQIVAFIAVLAVAALWSAISRRAEYHRLHGWMRLVLRYYVAIVMLRRLIAVFVLNRTAPPADLSFRLPRWLARARRVLKPIILVLATCVPLAFSSQISRRVRERPPLFGVYDVQRFVRNGDTIPPLVTDSTRWQRLVFSRPGVMSIKRMTDRLRPFGLAVDTMAHRVTFWPPAIPAQKSVLDYERLSNGTLRVHGVVRGDSLDLLLSRLDQGATYRLLRRE